jgi:hypothetical protein
MKTIEIPLSKTKLFFGICGSIIFVGLGFFLIKVVAAQQTMINSTIIKGIGILSILFFGATAIYGIRKITRRKIGLTIDETGITDNSSGVSLGLIEWQDIKSVRTVKIMSTKFLLIDTIRPKKYLVRCNEMKLRLVKANMEMYGTPISISSNTLKISFNELENVVQSAFEKSNDFIKNKQLIL